MSHIRYTRLYCDNDGESHYGEGSAELAPAEFAPPAPPINVANPIAADRFIFCSLPKAWIGAWHVAPCRQFYFQMSGHLRVTVSDGEQREFFAGSLVLLEDTSGKGHFTETLGDDAVECVFVQLPDSGGRAE